jgi:hypothetical protein
MFMLYQTPNSALSVSTIKRAFGPLRNPRTAKWAYFPLHLFRIAQAFKESPRSTSIDRTVSKLMGAGVFCLAPTDESFIFMFTEYSLWIHKSIRIVNIL